MVLLNVILQSVSIGIDPLITVSIVSILSFLSGILVYKRRSSELSYEDLDSEQKEFIDLIKQNGGKIKQKEVSENLEWPDTKTSRITTSLINDGFVDKNRSDRENYITINDTD